MALGRNWRGVLGGLLLLGGSGCTVSQQQQVLGTIGQIIPGSSNSIFSSGSSTQPASQPTSQSASQPTPESQETTAPQPTAVAPAPAPRVDPDRVDAQLVLRTLQHAMTDNPAPFQECLDNIQCRSALAAYLIRLQKQAMSTLELPPVYDRYDLQRGKE